MRVGLLVLVVLAFVVVSPVWAATTYYVATNGVDGGACTPASNPCRTFDYARTKLAAGDTLYFRQGSYPDIIIHGQQMVVSGTSNTNRTLIAGFPGEIVTLGFIDFKFHQGGSFYGLIQYVTFKNFRVQSLGGLGCYRAFPVDYSCGPHFIRWEDIQVTNRNGGGACIGNGFGASDLEYVNLHVYECGLDHDPGPNPHTHGFYACSPYSTYDNIHVHHNAGYGMQMYESTNDARNCGTGVVIRNSYIHHNGQRVTYGGIVGPDGHDVKVYNNVITHNNEAGIALTYSLDVGSINNMEVYNNTIVANNGAGVILGCQVNCQITVATNPKVRNNIFWQNNGPAVKDANVSAPIYSNNLCDTMTTGCSSTGQPAFEAPSSGTAEGYKILASSDARNAGTMALFPNTDKAGAPRPQPPSGNPDIGAYEYAEGGPPPPSCPAACPTTCISPTECPPTTTPTAAPIYLSAGGYGDTPSDSGDCTVPENSLTPRATLDAALLCMQIPGKVLYIRGGTYPGKINAWGGAMVGGIAADNPTRIEGYGSEIVTIELNEDGTPALLFNGINYVTVRNLIVDAMNRSGTNGLACLSSTNIKVLNSTFRQSYFEVGYFAACDQVEVTNSTFHTSAIKPVVGLESTISNVVFDQLTVYNGPLQGIAANAGSGSNSSLSILRTQIRNTGTGAGGAALDLGPGTGATLVNNIIDHNNAGVRIRSGASGTKLYHNAVASNTGVGIQCDSGASGVTISNNISFGNGTDSVLNNCSAMLASNIGTPPLNVDPLWVNSTTPPYDFHVQTTPTPSPALDQLSTVLPEATKAIDGTPRPVPAGGLADLGPYEQARPVPAGSLAWADRRPIARWMIANQPSISATNPRGYLWDSALNALNPTTFQAAIVAKTNEIVTRLNAMNPRPQGVIIWDLEGMEFPGNFPYVGDPRSLPGLAPEMDAVADQMFAILTAAGYRVGVTVRPSLFSWGTSLPATCQSGANYYNWDVFILTTNTAYPSTRFHDCISTNTWYQSPTGFQKQVDTNSTIITQLHDKIQYAVNRWGASLFYIDSTQYSADNPGRFTPDIYQSLFTSFPTVLMWPEFLYNVTPAAWQYVAGYWETLGPPSVPPAASAAFPQAFAVFQAFHVNLDDPAQRALMQINVNEGSVMLIEAWWDNPWNQYVQQAYQNKGLATTAAELVRRFLGMWY